MSRFLLVTTLFLAALALLAGCGKYAREARNDYEDARLAALVKARLIEADPLSTLRVEVYVEKRVVRLTGEVKRAEDSARLAKTAREVPGVAKVKDQLTVNPDLITPTDLKDNLILEQKVRGALLLHLGPQALDLKVKAGRGRLVLEGVLDSLPDVQKATQVASGVKGVGRVENRIGVRTAQPGSPEGKSK